MRYPKLYGPPIPGAISPVKATEDMTKPVGIRDMQLFTSPDLDVSVIIASAFSSYGIYEIGEYVTYNNKVYKALTPNGPGGWVDSNWEEVTIGQELFTLVRKVDDNQHNISAITATLEQLVATVAGKQAKFIAKTVTLSVNNWSANAYDYIDSDISLDDLIQISTQDEEASSADIKVTGQTDGHIYFSCSTAPQSDIALEVVIWKKV